MKLFRGSLLTWRFVAASSLTALVALPGCNKSKSSDSAVQGASSASPQTTSPTASLEVFEGEIGIIIRTGPESHEAKSVGPLNLRIKSGKIRVDAPTDIEQLKGVGRAYLVIAAAEKKIFAVLEDKKEIVTLELEKLGAQLKQMKPPLPAQAQAPRPAETPPKIVKSMRMDTVAGHSCHDWDITTERGKVTLCVSDQGVPWLSFPTGGLPVEHTWLSQLFDGRHFPLRMVMFENNRESGRVEVTKLEPKAVPAQLFDMPVGYRTVELQEAIREVMMASMGAASMPQGMPPNLPPDIAARINAARQKGASTKSH